MCGVFRSNKYRTSSGKMTRLQVRNTKLMVLNKLTPTLILRFNVLIFITVTLFLEKIKECK